MNVEVFTDFFYYVQLMYAIYVDPGDSGLVSERKTFLNSLGFFLFKMAFIIINYHNPYFSNFFLAYMNKSSRWKTSLFSSLLEESRHGNPSLAVFFSKTNKLSNNLEMKLENNSGRTERVAAYRFCFSQDEYGYADLL